MAGRIPTSVKTGQKWGTRGVSFLAAAEPLLEGFGSEDRDRALVGNSGDQFRDVAEERQLGGKIHEAGSVRREARPEIDVAEGIGAARADAAFIIMREELGLVGGDVHVDGAIALASLAGEAEIERLLDFFAAPAIADDPIFSGWALRHLPEKVSAAAGGVFFFACDPIAGTHDAAFFATAFANTDAAQGGVRQAAVVGGKLKARLRFPGRVVGAKAEIFVELVGVDELAGIHLPVGIPCGLELAEGLH